jgi:hypothetical protein
VKTGLPGGRSQEYLPSGESIVMAFKKPFYSLCEFINDDESGWLFLVKPQEGGRMFSAG